jgi:uridine monophosphate synthetase
VQKQYTEGPLTIAKWAELVTVHALPGPGIVTALQQAANNTIAQYNSTVHTEISAGRGDEAPEDSPIEGFTPIAPPPRTRSSDSSSSSPPPNGEFEKLHMTPGNVRKRSIVSISTTISTKSEPMSPQPANTSFLQPRSRTESIEDAYARLGSIPYLRACLLLVQMSSANNLLTKEYTTCSMQIARQYSDFVLGVIAQESQNTRADDNFLTFTPGVKLLEPGADRGDGLGQQYRTPKEVITLDGTDVIIVGRGIIKAENRIAVAESYRKEAWEAYESRIE